MKIYRPLLFTNSLNTILLFSSLLLIMACSGDSDNPGINNPNNPNNNVQWLVDRDLVFDGGVGRDGIPSIESPNFSSVSEVDFLSDDDLVLGIRIGDKIKAYPHPVLDWHEIVNDELGDAKFALTYCPLTGTGIGWDRVINGEENSFGVSGLLFETNLMPYDRNTLSTWSQQQLRCVSGSNIGQRARLYSFVETSWASWKAAYPESLVLNTDTGINRSYGNYPYGDYKTNHEAFLFPITTSDDRLESKERVLGIRQNDTFKVYPFDPETVDLGAEGSSSSIFPFLINLERDIHMGQDFLVVSSNELNLLVGFKVEESLEFKPLTNDQFPYIFADQNGTKYDMFGFADSETVGNLDLAEQFIGYWFSWGTFYPDVDLFEY